MPYRLGKKDGKFCVYNKDTGENKGCSDSRAKAVAHMRALYAVEGGAKMGKKELDNEQDVMALVNEWVKAAEDEFDGLFDSELMIIDEDDKLTENETKMIDMVEKALKENDDPLTVYYTLADLHIIKL